MPSSSRLNLDLLLVKESPNEKRQDCCSLYQNQLLLALPLALCMLASVLDINPMFHFKKCAAILPQFLLVNHSKKT
jgi:hypothetical protein